MASWLLVLPNITTVMAAEGFLTTATYRVTNVEPDDPVGLNVRGNVMEAASLSDTVVVGHLEWNARGIISSGKIVEFGGSYWRHIRLGEVVGWVNEKYLSEDTRRADPSKFPERLNCAGTEPFWSLNLSAANSSYTGANWSDGAWVEDVELELLTRQNIVARGDSWAVTVRQKSTENYIRSVIEVANPMCSDGMSDLLYPYSVILLKGRVPHAEHGCCSINIGR